MRTRTRPSARWATTSRRTPARACASPPLRWCRARRSARRPVFKKYSARPSGPWAIPSMASTGGSSQFEAALHNVETPRVAKGAWGRFRRHHPETPSPPGPHGGRGPERGLAGDALSRRGPRLADRPDRHTQAKNRTLFPGIDMTPQEGLVSPRFQGLRRIFPSRRYR